MKIFIASFLIIIFAFFMYSSVKIAITRYETEQKELDSLRTVVKQHKYE